LLLIQYLLGVEQAGYYSVAVTLTDALYMLPVTVGTILFPTLSGMCDDAQRWRFSKRIAGVIGLVMTAIAVITSFGAGRLIQTLYGSAFQPATAAFVWLLPGIVLLSVSSLLMNYGVDRDASHSHVFIRDRCHSECSVKPEVDSFARHSGRLNKHDGVGGHHVDYRPVVYPETSASGTRWTLRQ